MRGSCLRACRVRDCRGSEAVVLVVIELGEITTKTMEVARSAYVTPKSPTAVGGNFQMKNIFLRGLIKTLPKIASKFLFSSLRCKLSYQVLFLTLLRNNLKKVKSKVETFSLTFFMGL